MGVIFLVLGLLIGVIRLLVHLVPYQEPPATPQKKSAPPQVPAASGASQDHGHIAAIHAVLAHHLGKAPHEIHIQSITSL